MPISSVSRATSFSLALAAGLVLEGCGASSQSENYSYECFYDYVTSRSSRPEFEARLFYSPDSAGTRLDVYISVRESRLKFERDAGNFQASYSAVVRLIRKDRNPVVKEANRSIVRAAYTESSDNSYDAILLPFEVESGEYSVEITVTDNESKQKSTRTYEKSIPDVSGEPLALSDLLLLARYDTLDGSRKITPFILSNVALLPDTVKIFAAAVSRRMSEDSIFVSLYRLTGRSDHVPSYASGFYMSQPMSYDPCGEHKDITLVYSYWRTSVLGQGYSFIFGAFPKPPEGNYLLRMLVKDRMKDTAITVTRFRVYGTQFPSVSNDLHAMVNSLNYIATGREMRAIVRVKTDSAVKANLLNFWKDHGGFSKMAQYYRRVTQANRLFTSCIEGWKTPMGMFYIVCGPPDYVECRTWNEQWAYSKSSSQGTMIILFKLTNDAANIEDRIYGIESVYSRADLWSYYVNQWRNPF